MPVYNTRQRPSTRDDGWPTRSDVRFDTDAERLCRVLVGLVEGMGASLSLTRAVTLLAQARDAIADHVERIEPVLAASPTPTGPEPDWSYRCGECRAATACDAQRRCVGRGPATPPEPTEETP